MTNFFKNSLLSLLTTALVCCGVSEKQQTGLSDARLEKLPKWGKVKLADWDETNMTGPVGAAYLSGADRLSESPYTTDWLLSDVSFKIKRIFTNYSGDVSGRFIELGALLSEPDKLYPAVTLPEVLKEVTRYQKSDGHYGVDLQYGKTLKTNDEVVTMLWGNARMLVGLITAAERFGDKNLMNSAIRLGNFYIDTADWLCNPEREDEYKATGTAADSYQVGYFPAIESLTMLYNATADKRYLDMAERMAAFFYKFDGLPLNHSHGNLSAWRGILDLYNITGKDEYLQKTIGKWKDALDRGYVWALGGVAEHWYVDYVGSEGCSEADWLRLNLDLWRYTGQTCYLDMAERLLENQYAMDQSANGGYGMRHFDVIKDVGPVGTCGGVHEWDFCCSFHGPLGLHFLKKYFAATADGNIYINFPLSFSTQLSDGENSWIVTSDADPVFDTDGRKKVKLSVSPLGDSAAGNKYKILMRMPLWAESVMIDNAGGQFKKNKDGYVILTAKASGKLDFDLVFQAYPFVEARKFVKESPDKNRVNVYEDVSLVFGSQLMYEYPARNTSLSNILVLQDENGNLEMLQDADGSYVTVQMSETATDRAKILSELQSGRKVSLMPWPVPGLRRTAFSYNLVVVPKEMIPEAELNGFRNRTQDAVIPNYGSELEKNENLWPIAASWNFTPDGIHITGGDVGFIEGGGYNNYRFEFDMELPEDGAGISGWVVRAQDGDNYVMLQLQSQDTKYNDRNVKAKPNTLRIIPKINGSYIIEEPVVLSQKIMTGEKHRVVTECVGDNITIFIDGEKAAEYKNQFTGGLVGFRVSGPIDQGIFNNISLAELH